MKKMPADEKKEHMDKQKTNNKMIHVNLDISVITQNRKRRHTPIKELI